MPAGTDNERLRATVTGRVQGVGFRYFVLRRGQALGLKGWVRNVHSGGVQFVAEGPREALEKLVRSAREGPPMSWVEDVRIEWSAAKGDLDDFDVKYTI